MGKCVQGPSLGVAATHNGWHLPHPQPTAPSCWGLLLAPARAWTCGSSRGPDRRSGEVRGDQRGMWYTSPEKAAEFPGRGLEDGSRAIRGQPPGGDFQGLGRWKCEYPLAPFILRK